MGARQLGAGAGLWWLHPLPSRVTTGPGRGWKEG